MDAWLSLPIPWAPLWLSLKVAAWATLLAGSLGIVLGWVQARVRYPGREAMDAFLTLPMVLPPTVLGYYLLVLLGRHSVIGQWLQTHWQVQLVFTWQGAVIAASLVGLPLVYKSARVAFEGIPASLEDAARSLGLPGPAVFLRVSLPLAWRGILAGCLLAFARAMGEFGATLMVAGNIPGRTQTLAVAVYDAVQMGDDALANALVLITSVTCVLVLLLAGRFMGARP